MIVILLVVVSSHCIAPFKNGFFSKRQLGFEKYDVSQKMRHGNQHNGIQHYNTNYNNYIKNNCENATLSVRKCRYDECHDAKCHFAKCRGVLKKHFAVESDLTYLIAAFLVESGQHLIVNEASSK
jgi:hypothetical protein